MSLKKLNLLIKVWLDLCLGLLKWPFEPSDIAFLAIRELTLLFIRKLVLSGLMGRDLAVSKLYQRLLTANSFDPDLLSNLFPIYIFIIAIIDDYKVIKLSLSDDRLGWSQPICQFQCLRLTFELVILVTMFVLLVDLSNSFFIIMIQYLLFTSDP